ncbi:hypothetical protein CHS0354_024685 [Potamilus streckersoni]|uniref:Deoxynucleoside triphosphate triphosphohydrolase SAMHD1 n=1 Tax=Potamilus streckersoni TaxID=2493646 RepID=A0AAE0RWV5_9BIVA|nr:hypothetical protein CHS0354_024685 [Potamilus streckersoni]
MLAHKNLKNSLPDSQDLDDTEMDVPLPKRFRSECVNSMDLTLTDNCRHEDWTSDDVAQRMVNMGFDEEAGLFKAQEITGDLLPMLTSERLREMGVSTMGRTLRIMNFIKSITHQERKILNPSNSKVFNDPIHGHIELHPLCVKIIDTPQFQRLRYIKQLGSCYFVYPGASHNRFEHSIGVCHLAGQLACALQHHQPELDINDQDILCVQIAGLCHDLGHGPYSHLFDAKFIPLMRPDRKWKHEDASVEMFDYLIEDNNILPAFQEYGLDRQDITFIKEQIAGPCRKTKDKEWPYEGRSSVKSFLYEIVANKRNGIDVDKWDYFSRDCHMLGIRNNFDHSRFLHFARVLEVDGQLQICSRDKEVGNLYDMFHTRNTLHRRAYQHKTTNIIDIMITEAMIKANDYITFEGKNGKQLKMSEAIDDVVAYSKITDNILFQILNSSSDAKPVLESKEIIQNIFRRKLYKCVAQTQVIAEQLISKSENDSIKKEIVDDLEEPEESSLKPEDIIIHMVFLDYGMKDKNPIDNVRFYMKEKPDIAIKVRKDQVSQMLPEKFAEQHVRVYCKRDDPLSIHKVFQSFDKWCKKKNFPPPKGGNVTALELTPVIKKNYVTMSNGNPIQETNNYNPITPGSAGKFRNRLSF